MGQVYAEQSESLSQNQGKTKDGAFYKLRVLWESRYAFGEDVEIRKESE